MNPKNQNQETENEKLLRGILLLNIKVMAISFGLVGGLAIFIATNWLVIKGGDPVGPHLELLNQFFYGYRVSFTGSFIGFVYGFITGGICGALVGWIYNRIARPGI